VEADDELERLGDDAVIKSVTFHIWADGHGFYDLGPDASVSDVDFFRDFLKVADNQTDEGHAIIAGAPVTVVEHAGPFLPQEKQNLNEAKDAIYDQFIPKEEK